MSRISSVVRVITALSLAIFIVFGSSAVANATPSAATQGGANGVLYFTEKTLGTIYLGEIDSSPASQAVFWTDSASKVDEVAVTQRKIAWASQDLTSNMRMKIKISSIGSTAGSITEVSLPTTASTDNIKSLTADPFGERFFVTTSLGDIWAFNSDGLFLTKMFDGTTNSAISSEVTRIFWGTWFDPYNSKFYFCTNTPTSRVYVADVTGSVMSLPTLVNSNSPTLLQQCDGLGVDPYTQKIFTLKANSPYSWTTLETSGATTQVSTFVDANSNAVTRMGAPSSMFVSHSTGKMYFTDEQHAYESNFDGTGARVLYTGINIQNIAVYYGTDAANINSAPPVASAGVVSFNANGGSGSIADQTSSTPTPLTSNSFSRVGKLFSGWATSLANATAGTITYADGDTFPFTSSGTLYAVWIDDPNYKTVTFDANGGTGSIASQSSNSATTLTSNSFVRNGYTFTGWATSQARANAGTVDYANTASYLFTSSVTLYAVWTPVVNNSSTIPGSNGTASTSASVLANTGGSDIPRSVLIGLTSTLAGLSLVAYSIGIRRRHKS